MRDRAKGLKAAASTENDAAANGQAIAILPDEDANGASASARWLSLRWLSLRWLSLRCDPWDGCETLAKSPESNYLRLRSDELLGGYLYSPRSALSWSISI